MEGLPIPPGADGLRCRLIDRADDFSQRSNRQVREPKGSSQMTPLSRPRTKPASHVTIREHRIPSAGSKPYIAVQGPDGHLWFCESGASKIGRFDLDRRTFMEFELPTKDATPIGITAGADGNLWFAEKSANKIGRITPRGEITEFALPSPQAGPDAMVVGPDGNVWFSESRSGKFLSLMNRM